MQTLEVLTPAQRSALTYTWLDRRGLAGSPLSRVVAAHFLSHAPRDDAGHFQMRREDIFAVAPRGATVLKGIHKALEAPNSPLERMDKCHWKLRPELAEDQEQALRHGFDYHQGLGVAVPSLRPLPLLTPLGDSKASRGAGGARSAGEPVVAFRGFTTREQVAAFLFSVPCDSVPELNLRAAFARGFDAHTGEVTVSTEALMEASGLTAQSLISAISRTLNTEGSVFSAGRSGDSWSLLLTARGAGAARKLLLKT